MRRLIACALLLLTECAFAAWIVNVGPSLKFPGVGFGRRPHPMVDDEIIVIRPGSFCSVTYYKPENASVTRQLIFAFR